MKLEDILAKARTKSPGRGSFGKEGSDLAITVRRAGHVHNRVAILVYCERDVRFSKQEYWMPIYIPENHRLYLLKGDSYKNHAYKVYRGSKTAIGSVEFTDPSLSEYLVRNKLTGPHDFSYDPESKSYFVDLNK